MKKYVILVFVLLFLSALWLFDVYVPPDYSHTYGEVMRTNDISEVDAFLNENTQIMYRPYTGERKERTGTYGELRHNLIQAFEGETVKVTGSKGGFHYDLRDQYSMCSAFLDFQGEHMAEYVKIRCKRIGFFKYSVVSLECDGDGFLYMFFGEEAFEETIEDET